jgi:hypothetical protein
MVMGITEKRKRRVALQRSRKKLEIRAWAELALEQAVGVGCSAWLGSG